MYLGPVAGRRFGTWGRRAVWIVLISAMVILAEFDLIWLRGWLEQTDVIGTRWHYEAVYALVLLAVGLALVCGRVLQRTMAQGDQPDTERDEHNSCGRSPQ
jgi:hypothetical protein